jgi:fumarate hydratase class II
MGPRDEPPPGGPHQDRAGRHGRGPRPFLRALRLIKGAAARVNRDLGLLNAARASAIEAAAREVD